MPISRVHAKGCDGAASLQPPTGPRTQSQSEGLHAPSTSHSRTQRACPYSPACRRRGRTMAPGAGGHPYTVHATGNAGAGRRLQYSVQPHSAAEADTARRTHGHQHGGRSLHRRLLVRAASSRCQPRAAAWWPGGSTAKHACECQLHAFVYGRVAPATGAAAQLASYMARPDAKGVCRWGRAQQKLRRWNAGV